MNSTELCAEHVTFVAERTPIGYAPPTAAVKEFNSYIISSDPTVTMQYSHQLDLTAAAYIVGRTWQHNRDSPPNQALSLTTFIVSSDDDKSQSFTLLHQDMSQSRT
ncbi:hypothetical protein KIN20_018752 [Parelaphostrongylus tenuis]|uniref:Uncharacterized protein n=1 Tax=Parelaphostrongylus tenuis TaxID=148309 RepID=A0AAD5N7W5_PARTN|nr:hypothetical protein KIN20_018752 [Parelaphostrongylus tenuis]